MKRAWTRSEPLWYRFCVQNKTVVTNAFKGEDLNHYLPLFRHHEVPTKFNFREEDMRWEIYRPEHQMRALDKIYPGGIMMPDYFPGKNIVELQIRENAYQAALDHLRANDIEVFFEEDRQGGVVNGPRAYFRDPDGTVLEYIDLTSYSGAAEDS